MHQSTFQIQYMKVVGSSLTFPMPALPSQVPSLDSIEPSHSVVLTIVCKLLKCVLFLM